MFYFNDILHTFYYYIIGLNTLQNTYNTKFPKMYRSIDLGPIFQFILCKPYIGWYRSIIRKLINYSMLQFIDSKYSLLLWLH
uniref:Uncharacterized protein n=1 Tax=Trichogramma kaykai TaxID=54128 RepID=A0ABD2WFG6_9HYME